MIFATSERTENFRDRRFSSWQALLSSGSKSGTCVCACVLVCHAGKREWINRITFWRSHDAGAFSVMKGVRFHEQKNRREPGSNVVFIKFGHSLNKQNDLKEGIVL